MCNLSITAISSITLMNLITLFISIRAMMINSNHQIRILNTKKSSKMKITNMMMNLRILSNSKSFKLKKKFMMKWISSKKELMMKRFSITLRN